MSDTNKIRELNDAFRTSLQGGRVMVTRSVAKRPDLANILDRVRRFDQFEPSDDPYGEHDFGAFQIGDEQLFWKLDYYGVDTDFASPDPSDPNITARVLTIMMAEEY